jgi:hypothetical protein
MTHHPWYGPAVPRGDYGQRTEITAMSRNLDYDKPQQVPAK